MIFRTSFSSSWNSISFILIVASSEHIERRMKMWMSPDHHHFFVGLIRSQNYLHLFTYIRDEWYDRGIVCDEVVDCWLCSNGGGGGVGGYRWLDWLPALPLGSPMMPPVAPPCNELMGVPAVELLPPAPTLIAVGGKMTPPTKGNSMGGGGGIGWVWEFAIIDDGRRMIGGGWWCWWWWLCGSSSSSESRNSQHPPQHDVVLFDRLLPPPSMTPPMSPLTTVRSSSYVIGSRFMIMNKIGFTKQWTNAMCSVSSYGNEFSTPVVYVCIYVHVCVYMCVFCVIGKPLSAARPQSKTIGENAAIIRTHVHRQYQLVNVCVFADRILRNEKIERTRKKIEPKVIGTKDKKEKDSRRRGRRRKIHRIVSYWLEVWMRQIGKPSCSYNWASLLYTHSVCNTSSFALRTKKERISSIH